MGKYGAFAAALLGAPGAYVGAGRGFLGASAQVVHQHTKIAPFPHFGATAFPDCLQTSVLRAFLGGLFGFIGARCIFDWVVVFVGLVGLYACIVRRLRTEKRKPAYFIGLLRPAFSWLYWLSWTASLLLLLVVVCLVVVACIALHLLLLGFSWVVGCGSLSLRTI